MPVVNVHSTSVTSENVSRFELLAWVNDSLQSNFSKIEEMATAAAYCQLTDLLFPNKVPLKKVKWNSRLEVDWLNNWRVLQLAWKSIGIDKPVQVQMLMKGKFQDNFEFLQWFKKFFDANYDGHAYDPLTARNGEELPAALPSGAAAAKNARTAGRQSIASRPPQPPPASRTITTRTSVYSRPPASNNVTVKAKPPPAAASFQSTRAAAPKRAPLTASTAATTARRSMASPLQNGAAAAANAKIAEESAKLKAQAATLNEQLTEVRESLAVATRERDFFFKKLRSVELMCGDLDEEHNAILVKNLHRVLFTADEGFDEVMMAQGVTVIYTDHGDPTSTVVGNGGDVPHHHQDYNQELNATCVLESTQLVDVDESQQNITHSVAESFLELNDSIGDGALENGAKNEIFTDLMPAGGDSFDVPDDDNLIIEKPPSTNDAIAVNHETTSDQERNDTVTIKSEPVDVAAPHPPIAAQPPADEPKLDEFAKEVEEPSSVVVAEESHHPAQEQHVGQNIGDPAPSDVGGAGVTLLDDVSTSAKSDNLLNFDDSETF